MISQSVNETIPFKTCLLYGYADELDNGSYLHFLRRLPVHLREEIENYVFDHDRKSRLLGKLLLQAGLRQLNLSPHWIYELKKTDFSRPYIAEEIDFNISHSGNLVTCVVSNESKVGLDVERLRQIDYQKYQSCCTTAEWAAITTTDDPSRQFIRLWTIKESVSKAEGRGLHIPFHRLVLEHNKVQTTSGKSWHVKHILLDAGYACSLSHKALHINLEISRTGLTALKKTINTY